GGGHGRGMRRHRRCVRPRHATLAGAAQRSPGGVAQPPMERAARGGRQAAGELALVLGGRSAAGPRGHRACASRLRRRAAAVAGRQRGRARAWIAVPPRGRRRGRPAGPAGQARPGREGHGLAATGACRAHAPRHRPAAPRLRRRQRVPAVAIATLALLAQTRVSRTLRRRAQADHEGGDWGDMPPLLRRLHAARGAHGLVDAQPRLGGLLPPDGLLGLDTAVDLLAAAIAKGRHIVVVGDFDCDGATACATGVRGLRMLGATRVSHAVPNRQVHGYGLSPGLVDDLAALQPELLVTVDHGIACHAGIAAAKARGWQVLVTDHHLAGPQLPPADAIVDPNRPGDMFPSKALAGVGVMFYLLLALRARLFADDPARRPDLSVLLDLVAVGTVADLVPLDANNRALVAAGLRRLRAGRGCTGLRALIEVAGRDEAALTATDIGYALA